MSRLLHPIRSYNDLVLFFTLKQNRLYQRLLGPRKFLLKQEDMLLHDRKRFVRRLWTTIAGMWLLNGLLHLALQRALSPTTPKPYPFTEDHGLFPVTWSNHSVDQFGITYLNGCAESARLDLDMNHPLVDTEVDLMLHLQTRMQDITVSEKIVLAWLTARNQRAGVR